MREGGGKSEEDEGWRGREGGERGRRMKGGRMKGE